MKEYESKSFEELRYEDCKSDRKYAEHPVKNLYATSAELSKKK
jgi:hypothetical protein